MSAKDRKGLNDDQISKTEEEQGSEEEPRSSSKGGLSKLTVIPNKIEAKTKQILHVNDRQEDKEPVKTEALSLIENDPAFRPRKLIESQKETDKKQEKPSEQAWASSSNASGGGKLRSIANAIKHPKESIKKKATKKTAAKLSSTTQRPYISESADLDLLSAHNEACSAQEASSSSQNVLSTDSDGRQTTDRYDEDYWRKFNEMKAHRESLHVAWTTSRHVNRVRVVPKRQIEYPDPKDYSERDDQGHLVSFDILKWLGHV